MCELINELQINFIVKCFGNKYMTELSLLTNPLGKQCTQVCPDLCSEYFEPSIRRVRSNFFGGHNTGILTNPK